MARLVIAVQGVRHALGLELFKGTADAVRIGYDPAQGSFFIDRRTTQPLFAGQSERYDAARVLDEPTIILEIWVDGSTVELFADGGTVTISDLVYADRTANGVALFHGPEVLVLECVELHQVRPVMHAAVG